MDDKVLKGYVIDSLNEIKRLALLLYEIGLPQEDLMNITDGIVEECDLTIGELKKGK